jgi:hypothetical protein
MNCADVRKRLLLSERPDKPGVDESRHLSGCSACHAWLRRLVRLERKITELHVPACPVPAGLLEQITESDEAPLVRSPLRPSAGTRSVREVGRQKLALAIALAATLALFTLAWWQWPPRENAGAIASPWPKIIDKRKNEAPTPRERAEVLAGLADELLADAQANGDKPLYVALLAEDFDGLVSDLFIAAQSVPAADRARLADIADRVGRTESAAARLAVEWKAHWPRSVPAISRMAESAREAEKRIRRLTRA